MLNSKSVRFKLISVFSLFTAIILLIITTFLWSDYRTWQIDENIARLNQLNLTTKEILINERDFTIYETINPDFFKTGNSKYFNEYDSLLQKLDTFLTALEKDLVFPEDIETKFKSILEIRTEIENLQKQFSVYVATIRKRGFKDYGLEGEMRKVVHELEGIKQLDAAKVLTIRRHEKDYFLRKEESYVNKLKDAVVNLKMDAEQKITDPIFQQKVLSLTDDYFKIFQQIYELDKVLGLQGKSEGLRVEISNGLNDVQADITLLNQYMQNYTANQKFRVGVILASVVSLLLILGLVLGGIIITGLGRSIRKLSGSIYQVIQSNFSKNIRIEEVNTGDEIERLSKDVSLMLEKVHQRTDEVLEQKELISQSYQRIEILSQIGKKITNALDIHKIILMSYNNIKPLIDTTIIAIGIYEEEKKGLQFYGNNGEKVESSFDSLDQEHLFSIQCFHAGKQIFVNHLAPEQEVHVVDASRKSLIYEPLIVNQKHLGVITVQHTEPGKYQEYHLDILKNIAVYTAIALDNAQVYQKLQLQSQELMEKTEELLTSEEELKQQAEELAAQRDALEEQSAELVKKNDDIVSSINYAKRIQKAIIPAKSRIKESLSEFFIIFTPRDVVSGDFYWYAHKDSKIILAAIDCTGHGVPGAFMSMIGSELLNHLVHDKEIHSPEVILYEMHKGIRYALKQNESDNRDGMDVTLIVIDKINNLIEYAGAKNSLVYIQDNQLTLIKGDKMPIGGEQREIERIFTKHTIPLLKPFQQPLEDEKENLRLSTMLYLYSDGYQDQFGGKDGKKFLSSRMRDLMFEIHQQPMDEQKRILKKTLTDWMLQANQKQIDDILMIGVRV